MANNVSGDPLILDTANTTTVVDPRGLIITKVRWVGATTAAHHATIKNADGATIIDMVATGANYTEESTEKMYCKGLIMHTLGSGIVYVYYK